MAVRAMNTCHTGIRQAFEGGLFLYFPDEIDMATISHGLEEIASLSVDIAIAISPDSTDIALTQMSCAMSLRII